MQPPALRKTELKWDLMMHKSSQHLYLGQISPRSLQCHLFRLSKRKKNISLVIRKGLTASEGGCAIQVFNKKVCFSGSFLRTLMPLLKTNKY